MKSMSWSTHTNKKLFRRNLPCVKFLNQNVREKIFQCAATTYRPSPWKVNLDRLYEVLELSAVLRLGSNN